MDGPLAGAELALGYLLGDEAFAAYAARTAAGITRARVSEPILPALVAALWRSRAGAEQRALVVVVADDDAAMALAESAAVFLPPDTAAFLPSRGVGWGSGLDPAPHLVGERHRATARARARRPRGRLGGRADRAHRAALAPARAGRAAARRGAAVRRSRPLRSPTPATSARRRSRSAASSRCAAAWSTCSRRPAASRCASSSSATRSSGSRPSRSSPSARCATSPTSLIHPAAEYSGSDPEYSGWGREDDDGPVVPDGLVPLAPELRATAAVVAWNPAELAAEILSAHAEASERLRDPALRARGYVAAEAVTDLIDSVPALEEMPLGQPYQFEAQLPALASSGISRGRERAARARARRLPRARLLRAPRRGPAHPHVAAPGRGRPAGARRGRA